MENEYSQKFMENWCSTILILSLCFHENTPTECTIFGVIFKFDQGIIFLPNVNNNLDQNVSNTEIFEEIFPVWNYSYFAFLIPIGIVSEIFGHKIVILLSSLMDLATNLILVYGKSFRKFSVSYFLSSFF
jgi:hypothetical protein